MSMDEIEIKYDGRQRLANIAIFWDIENVTPKRGSFFTDGLLEFAEGLGKVVIQNAYADWSEKRFHQLGLDLAQHHFYMVHLPYRRNQRSKNGADIQLVSDALDCLRVYDHIDTYVLVTGDSDFRPLVRPLRRMGKTIHIICDIRNASQDLLMIADSFQDYHELLPSRDEEDDVVESRTSRQGSRDGKDTKTSRDDKDGRETKTERGVRSAEEDSSYWFNRLCEAVQALETEEKTINLSTLRVRIRMLNPGFDERKLGYRRWSQFITAAAKENYIRIESRQGEDGEDSDSEQLIRVVEQAPNAGSGNALTLQKAIQELLAILQQAGSGSGTDKDADEEGYLLYGILSSRLRERSINVQELGFNQFKKFMASAEARGLIETKLENLNYSARLPDAAGPSESPDESREETNPKPKSIRKVSGRKRLHNKD
ncbi:NYN domain-containing protein [Candidatus Haliotispira prima]|uniref:NYN domain-containing protein n=1 Tax=Candidatus Haliotispira prima TaxID=3034016 RepID=A0ABY8MKA7_9SPIO|nr:NYN domain-containing protein [Candidatus Haliotispira prima]